MQAYMREGEERAMALGNRGPIRFGADGSLHPDILAAFSRCGFYVFEEVLGADELADIEADFHDILERLPVERGSPVDAQGRPALEVGRQAPSLFWSKPLGDPFGGTAQANNRHPVKMTEPTPAADAPAEVVYLILGSLQYSEAFLRVYGHPQLLAVAAGVNGKDFVPFNEALFIKEPAGRLGRLAPGRHYPLGQSLLGRGHPRLQLHGATLRLHPRQRRMDRSRHAQARQGGHWGDGCGSGLGAAA